MGWNFYDPKTAPAVFSIVWCKWPYREAKLAPSNEARPVLVLDVRDHIYEPTGQIFADITVAYGTGADNVPDADLTRDLLVDWSEIAAAGLHKPTLFQLGTTHRKRLPWGDKYFVPNEYVAKQQIVCGKLSSNQAEWTRGCFKARGLSFPLP